MIKMFRDPRGTLWSPDRTVSIRTRYKDSPRGGLGNKIEDFAVTDHLFEHRRGYELTMARARAAAEHLISKHPVIAWSAWQQNVDRTHTCVSPDGLVRLLVEPMDYESRPIQIRVETAARPLTLRWNTPWSLAAAQSYAQAHGAKVWHQEIGG